MEISRPDVMARMAAMVNLLAVLALSFRASVAPGSVVGVTLGDYDVSGVASVLAVGTGVYYFFAGVGVIPPITVSSLAPPVSRVPPAHDSAFPSVSDNVCMFLSYGYFF